MSGNHVGALARPWGAEAVDVVRACQERSEGTAGQRPVLCSGGLLRLILICSGESTGQGVENCDMS